MSRLSKSRRPKSKFGATAADRLVDEYYRSINFNFSMAFDPVIYNLLYDKVEAIAKATKVDAQDLGERWFLG